MAIEGNQPSGAAYFRFAEEMDPDMVQVQVDNGKAKGLASVKLWILENWRLILGIIMAFILLGIGIIIGHAIVGHPIRSKAKTCQCVTNNTANPPARPQLNVTQLYQSYVSIEKLKEYFTQFTSVPHHAGSDGNKANAAYIIDQWKSFGFDVHEKSYRVTLSRPHATEPNIIQVVDTDLNDQIQANLNFPLDDNEAIAKKLLPAFNPYSATNVSLMGDPVYVNFGRLEDFKFIKDKMNSPVINAKGRICIARFGVMPLSRLVTNCENEGAIGVIAFPDPAIYGQGGDHPKDTWWQPFDGIIRDSARSTYGDPGSFFYPSLDNDSAIDLESLGDALPSIPVQVISYDNAKGILRELNNPKAPKHFHSNSSANEWHMGPGFWDGDMNHDIWRLKMIINTNVTSETITNVIAVMKGSVEPDRYIIVGNHRDSLTFGGVEPGTGSACLMELARALGQLKTQGWKPRRTIILASWDAGEEGHIGSTEWVEEHLEILHERAVAYINLDEAVSGTHTFAAEGSPLLAQVLYQATNKIDCPDKRHTNMRIYKNWLQKRPNGDHKEPLPRMDPPGTTSDLTPFLHLAGVPSVDLKYIYNEDVGQVTVPTYPLMHTAFDTADYVMKQVDSDFTIHAAVTKVAGEVLLELADATLLPVVVDHYSDELIRYATELSTQYGVELNSVIKAAEEFDKAAHIFQRVVDKVNVSEPFELRDVNDKLMAVERAFLGHGGMTLQEQQLRHVIYGPSVGHPYQGVAFPMLANTLFTANVTGDDSEFRKHLPHLANMIKVAAKVLDDSTVL